MNKILLKKLGLGVIYLVLGIYVLFLILPLIANPFLSKYTNEISKLAEENSGLKIKIEKLRLVTTPKLTIGIKIGQLSAGLPNGEEFLSAENAQAKLSLIPLIAKKVEADMFSVDYIEATLKVKPDGNLEIIDYLPETGEEENSEQLTSLPMGLKLSNRLPNVYIKEYIVTMVDMRDHREYTVQGGNLRVTDFVLNKGVKFSTVGFAKLDGEQQFAYNIKIKNKIMPDIDINDLIFAQSNKEETSPEKKTPDTQLTFNFIDIFKGIKQNGLTADTTLNIETSGTLESPKIKGLFDIEKLSLLSNGKKLPDSHVKLDFKGNKTIADIAFYTAEQEAITINGNITTGKKQAIDLSLKSNSEINNIFNILKSIASSFNYNELETLTATGVIDANLNIKSNMKQVTSNGYFKIPQATVKYALFNVFIDKINADIAFNNNVDIKNIGLTILSQPLKIFGKIETNADTDIQIAADKMIVKGLLTALGQINLLKDNDIKSGLLSINGTLKGNLRNIEPNVNISLDNLNLINKPSNTGLQLKDAKVNILANKNKYKGDINLNSIAITNPTAKISVPKVFVTLNEQDVNIEDTYLLMDNSRIDISGKITDYTTKNLVIDLKAKGNLVATDLLKMVPAEFHPMFSSKGSLPVLATVNGNDKKQVVNIQLLATPNGYFHITDLDAVSGKSLLANSKINIEGNSLNLEKTGIFATTKTSLSDNPASNADGTPVVKVTGGISDLANLTLKNLNISTNGVQRLSVPTFTNSKASIDANITLNGNALNPKMNGFVKSSSISIPTMKTKLENITVDLGNTITVNAPVITVADSKMGLKALISPNFTNGVIIKNVDFNSAFINADTLAEATASTATGTSSSTQPAADLGVIIQSGKASITKFQTGKIIATNLTSDFNLKNNIFTLKNLAGNAFNGKINGNISVNIIKGNTNVEMSGSGMNALNAIEASAGIPNALSGTLDFNAKLALNAFAADYNAMLKSIKGSASFDIKDGTYLNIGTIDQLVLANNVLSNAVLKAAVTQIKNLPVIKNSSQFATITGTVKLNNGIATLSPVKSSGKSIAYYVTGDYNLINGYTNVNILGRMGADLVAALGPLGDLSVSKISAYLPKFGANTLNLLSNLTSNPAAENVSQIPALSDGTTNYKDFKIVFNGNVTSPAAIKSFKWLSNCDTSEITTGSAVNQLKNEIKDTKQNIQNNIETAKQRAEEAKANAQAAKEDAKQQYENAKNKVKDLKNLFNTPKAE